MTDARSTRTGTPVAGPYRPASRGSPLLWRSGDRRSRLRRWLPASRRCRCGPAVRHRDDAGDDVLGDDYRQRGSNSGTTQWHCQRKSVAETAFCSPKESVCRRRWGIHAEPVAGFSPAMTPMGSSVFIRSINAGPAWWCRSTEKHFAGAELIVQRAATPRWHLREHRSAPSSFARSMSTTWTVTRLRCSCTIGKPTDGTPRRSTPGC